VLRYLAGTKDLGITYKAGKESDPIFHGYADAAYANADDHKSTSGYVFLSGGGAITWRSKKQTMIAMSSMEAKYVALSEAGCKACWLKNLYKELGVQIDTPINIKGDNKGSLAMAKKPQFPKQAKHIMIHWHWVRNLVKDKIINVESCRDPEHRADILTKALACPKHKNHVIGMGLMMV
jgi:hypothetical protein